MTNATLDPAPFDRMSRRLWPRGWVFFGLGLLLVAVGLLAPIPQATIVAAGGLGAVAAGLILSVRSLSARRGEKRIFDALTRFLEDDPAPAFTTDAQSRIGYQNAAARERFGIRDGASLLRALGGSFAAPAAVLERLQMQAAARGSAIEEVAMRDGHLRLTAQKMGSDAFLWRLDDTARPDAAAGVDALSLPMLTATRTGTILNRNRAMREIVGETGGTLDDVILDLPIRSGGIHQVKLARGTARVTIHEAQGSGGWSEIYFLPSHVNVEASDWNVLDALPVPLLKIAASGEVELANRLARDLLDDPMAVGTPMAALVEGLGRPVHEWLADAIEGRALGKPEVVRASRPSRDVFLQITLGRVEEDGEVSLVAVLHDATELKTLEAQFVQSQKMQAIGQLAGGVAHDFNNLLTAISGHCDLLLLRHDAGDPDYADLSQIAQNANRAASLVGQLLAFSRKQNLQPQMLDLRDTLSDLTHLLNRLVGEKITLVLDHDPELKFVRADKRQLEQVLMNLVVNARDAMPRGGTIQVMTRMLYLREALHRDRAIVPPGEWVEVRVIDAGTGIAPDKLPKIFEPFYTTKRTGEGTGLGLSTAYGIVKQTGGFIFADSEVGQGTTFTLLLPAHAAPVAAPLEPVAQTAAGQGQGEGVILLVEDEAPVRAFASRALRMKGYTVLEAENAEEALQLLSDDSLRVDLFVTDVIMPGMDGPTWVRRALEDRPEVAVVFVSGYAEDHFADEQARIPGSTFLPKPFTLTDLVAAVHAKLGRG
jgi:two-component system cell cycle sensor histidine kinase/response regulator CckA